MIRIILAGFLLDILVWFIFFLKERVRMCTL